MHRKPSRYARHLALIFASRIFRSLIPPITAVTLISTLVGVYETLLKVRGLGQGDERKAGVGASTGWGGRGTAHTNCPGAGRAMLMQVPLQENKPCYLPVLPALAHDLNRTTASRRNGRT